MKNKIKALSIFLLWSLCFVSSQAQSVKIGPLEWTTENLNVATFRNGDLIPEAKTAADWKNAGNSRQPAWCYYDFNADNGTKYGKLYNYYAATDPRNIAPLGWHIPDFNEYYLLDDVIPYETKGKKLKSKSIKGNNASGFNALGSGVISATGDFSGIKREAQFWFVDEAEENKGTSLSLNIDLDFPSRETPLKAVGLALRCIKDANGNQEKGVAVDGSSFFTIKLGEQTWFSQNLNVSKFRNGDDIPQATSPAEWKQAGSKKQPIWAYMGFNETNKKYGKIYNFYAVKDPRGLAPAGYRVPNNDDWEKLIVFAGGGDAAGHAIRVNYGWDTFDKALKIATNHTRFSAFPVAKIWGEGTHHKSGSGANWWSTTLYDDDEAYFYSTTYVNGQLSLGAGGSFEDGYTVRCIKE